MITLTICNILIFLLEVYQYAFMVYIILSFFPVDENNALVRMLVRICEPPYALIMRVLPPLRFGMIDFSPLYLFLIIWIMEQILKRLPLLLPF